MSIVRLLGFCTLQCGCQVGRYRELATQRELCYVEQKSETCANQKHRRNQVLTVKMESEEGLGNGAARGGHRTCNADIRPDRIRHSPP